MAIESARGWRRSAGCSVCPMKGRGTVGGGVGEKRRSADSPLRCRREGEDGRPRLMDHLSLHLR